MDVVIVGAGGMGREALAWLRDATPGDRVVGFLDDNVPMGVEVAGLEVLGGRALLHMLDAEVVVAIGDATHRATIAAAAAGAGRTLRTIVHPSTVVGPGCTVEAGVIVGPNVTMTRDVSLRAGAIVNYGAQVGHDCVIGRNAFVGPGACLAGDISVGDGAWIGIGATVLQGVRIGDGAMVGAGAVVTTDVEPGATVAGVPARRLDTPSRA